jgi:hypothetical protein
MSTDRSNHRPSFSAAGLSGSRAISMMRSESRTEGWPASAGSARRCAPSRRRGRLRRRRASARSPACRRRARPCACISPGPAAASSPIMSSARSRGCSLPAPRRLRCRANTGNARRQRAAGAAGTASARRWHPRSAPINCSAAPLLAPGRGRCARRANAGQGRAASPRPTRGQGSQRCPCARVTAFTFSLKRSTAYGANGKRTLPHVDHERGAGPCWTSSGLRGTQPIRLEQKFEFLVRRANRRIQWIGQRAARNAENECSR